MSKFTFRFGTLKSASVETSAKGKAYVRYAIDAGKFTAYGVAFDNELMKLLVETQEGEKVRCGGFIESNTVQTEAGERVYKTLVTRAVKIADAEMVLAAKGAAVTAEEEAVVDDLTAIKGIGPKVAEKLNDLGYTTFAKLAAADARERSILDEDVPSIKGALSRANIFEQAAELAAA